MNPPANSTVNLATSLVEAADAASTANAMHDLQMRTVMEALPAAVYTTDAAGRITYYNRAAVELAGREPKLGDEWCVSWRLYRPDGRSLPHDQCPMAVALKENRPIRGAEAIAERPDGTRVPFMPFPTPLRDESGALIGAVNMLVDITERKRAERDLHLLLQISQRLSSTLEIDSLMDCLIQEALQLVGAESGCSGLRTPDGMVCKKYFQQGAALPLEYCWPPGHGLPGWLIQHKVPYLTNDALGDGQIVHELCKRFGVWSALSTPILGADGEAIGFFEIHNKKDGTGFTQHDQDRLLTVSNIASIAIQNAKSYDSIRRGEALRKEHGRRLEALNRISRAISSDLDLDRIVQTVTDSATELSGARFGAFFYNLIDEKGESYSLYTLSGAPREAFEKFGMPRNTSVFEPTFRGTAPIRSDDIRSDPRYGKSAPHYGMPKGHLPVVSYLAVPVVSRSGEVQGGLFFGHEQPGVFTEEAEEIVSAIAAHAAIALDNARLLKAAQREIEQRRHTEQILQDREQHLSAIFAQATAGFAETDVNARFTMVNDRYCEITGRSRDELLRLHVFEITHPDDLAGNVPLLERLVKEGEPFEIEKRYVRPDGSSVWVNNSVFGIRGSTGSVEKITAVCIDITERKLHEQRQKLLLNELNHRVKNTLATVQSIAVQTLRNVTTPLEGRHVLEDRLVALSKAHDVLTHEHWEGADLHELVTRALSAYSGENGDGRFEIAGPRIRVLPKAALALSMTLHELATNAVKYGSLSSEAGRVGIGWSLADDLRRFSLRWAESGGPAVVAPRKRGFGSRLIEQGLAHDIAASVQLRFEAQGLICTIDAPRGEVTAA